MVGVPVHTATPKKQAMEQDIFAFIPDSLGDITNVCNPLCRQSAVNVNGCLNILNVNKFLHINVLVYRKVPDTTYFFDEKFG